MEAFVALAVVLSAVVVFGGIQRDIQQEKKRK